MRIPIGNRHEATVSGQVPLPFTCAYCNYETLAVVQCRGDGGGANLLWLDGDGAKAAASRRAEESLRKRAEDTLTFVHCPRCGTRDRMKMVSFLALRVLGLIAVVLLFIGLGALRPSRYGSEGWTWVFGLIAAGCSVWIYFRDVHWIHSSASARTQLLSREQFQALTAKLPQGPDRVASDAMR